MKTTRRTRRTWAVPNSIFDGKNESKADWTVKRWENYLWDVVKWSHWDSPEIFWCGCVDLREFLMISSRSPLETSPERRERKFAGAFGEEWGVVTGVDGIVTFYPVMMRSDKRGAALVFCDGLMGWKDEKQTFWSIFRSSFQLHRNRGACVDTRFWTIAIG